MSEKQNVIFDPMKFVVTESNSGGLPANNYTGKFVGAEYLPAQEADAMTGEGGRQWAKIVFRWEILEGEYKGKFASRETPVSTGAKSSYVAVCGQIVGGQQTAGMQGDLSLFIGRKYMLTVAKKLDRNGAPTNWTHVSHAILMS
jgi:hypothetical protein